MFKRDGGTLEKFRINVNRQTYHVFEDQLVGAESRDRLQVQYFEEGFSTMMNPVTTLFQNGVIAWSGTDAIFSKVALPAQSSGSIVVADSKALNPSLEYTENNYLMVRFRKSIMYWTFANPQTFAIQFKLERYGWNKRYAITADESLITRARQYLGQYYTSAVRINGDGSAAQLQYPTLHGVPGAGFRNASVPYNEWEGHVPQNRVWGSFCIKKLSTRKWTRLLPGGVVTYKLARAGVSFPVKADTPPTRFNHFMQYMLRMVWKSDIGYFDQSEGKTEQMVMWDPLLCAKVTHNYRVEFYEFNVGGPVNLLVRTNDLLNSNLPNAPGQIPQQVQAGNVPMENAF